MLDVRQFVGDDAFEFVARQHLPQAHCDADGAVPGAAARGEGIRGLSGGDVDAGHGQTRSTCQTLDNSPKGRIVVRADFDGADGSQGNFVAEEEGEQVEPGSDDQGRQQCGLPAEQVAHRQTQAHQAR